MEIGVSLFIIAILIATVWIFIEVKRLKHKLFAIFLIGLILFSYISFTIVLKKESVDLKTISGLMDASKIYFSWLGSLFGNFKSITSYAVKQDWASNETTTKPPEK